MDTVTDSPVIDDLAMVEELTVSAPEPAAEEPERPRDARWGFLKDGVTPRRRPGRPRKEGRPRSDTPRARARRAGPAATKGPGKASSSAPTPPKPPKTTDYTEAIAFWLGAAVAPLGMVYPLDAMAIHMNAGEILATTNQLANDIPWLGAWFDKAKRYTPYAAALTLITKLGVQIGHNHGLIGAREAQMFGAVPREQLAQMMAQQRAEAEAEAAAEQQRFETAMAAATGQAAAA